MTPRSQDAYEQHIVRLARGWIGTPYRHQASCLHAGADCLGLLRGVWRALYGAEPAPIPPYGMGWFAPEGDEVLWQAARRYLHAKALEEERPGDVLLFRMQDGVAARHLGIATTLGAQAAFIHAYARHAVLESPLSSPWRRRIVARFTFPKETIQWPQ
ncbi:MAG: peptidase [Rhodobacteraceae bacterium]|nr:peptidase [Paracoccaceae bacterium]